MLTSAAVVRSHTEIGSRTWRSASDPDTTTSLIAGTTRTEITAPIRIDTGKNTGGKLGVETGRKTMRGSVHPPPLCVGWIVASLRIVARIGTESAVVMTATAIGVATMTGTGTVMHHISGRGAPAPALAPSPGSATLLVAVMPGSGICGNVKGTFGSGTRSATGSESERVKTATAGSGSGSGIIIAVTTQCGWGRSAVGRVRSGAARNEALSCADKEEMSCKAAAESAGRHQYH